METQKVKNNKYVIICQESPLEVNHKDYPSVTDILNNVKDFNVKRIEGPITYKVLKSFSENGLEFSKNPKDAYIFINDKYKATVLRSQLKYGNPMIIPISSLNDFMKRIYYRLWDESNNKKDLYV